MNRLKALGFAFAFIIVSLLCIHLFLSQASLSISKKIASIPAREQRALHSFFHYLITESSFSYTLFGNKPMSFEEFSEDIDKLNFENLLYPYIDTILGEGWKTWVRYKHLFNHPHYIFRKMPSRSGYHFIILINQKACKETIENNLELFKQILKEFTLTSDQIFHRLAYQQNQFFEDILANDQRLIGILLGFGKENATFFSDRDQILTQIAQRDSSLILKSLQPKQLDENHKQLLKAYQKAFPTHRLKEREDDESLTFLCEKLQIMQKEESSFYEPSCHWVNRIGTPEFFCIKNSSETLALKENYQEIMNTLKVLPLTNELLTVSLTQLTHE